MNTDKVNVQGGAGDDGYLYWSVADLVMDLDERPSDVRAAIEGLGIEPDIPTGDVGLFRNAALRRLKQYFRDRRDLDGNG